MTRPALSVADWISLSRVGLAFIFVGSFRSEPGTMLTVSIVSAVLAQITDHLDGFLARRGGLVSVRGWLFDSVGDRAFYIAALLAFDREYQISETLVWLFVMREIALYAFRVAIGDFETRRPGFRTLALAHAGLVRLGIALGCSLPFDVLRSDIRPYATSVLTFIFVAASLFGYVCLVLLLIPKRR